MNSNAKFSVQVKQQAHGRWFEILEYLEPSLKDAIQYAPNHVPSPKRGGTDGFRFLKDGNLCGAAVDNIEGVFSNGFDLLLWLNEGSNFGEQLSRVARYLGLTGGNTSNIVSNKAMPSYQYKRPEPTEDELNKRRLALRKVWSGAFPLCDRKAQLARRYLTNRGLDINKLNLSELSKNIRFHPNCSLWHRGKSYGYYPAIISLVRNTNGEAVTIHRTYLDRNGNKLKLSVDGKEVNTKKFMSACTADKISGSAVRLSKAKEVLHVAEGLETTLSVSQAIQDDVWMCGNSHLLSLLDLPENENVKVIYDWADKDRLKDGKCAGTDAAIELSQRMKERGIEVIALFPEDPIPEQAKSVDWNDVLIKHGEAPFLRMMQQHHHVQCM